VTTVTEVFSAPSISNTAPPTRLISPDWRAARVSRFHLASTFAIIPAKLIIVVLWPILELFANFAANNK